MRRAKLAREQQAAEECRAKKIKKLEEDLKLERHKGKSVQRRTVQWLCQTDKGLEAYEPELNRRLESAYQAGDAQFAWERTPGFSYTISLQQEPAVQINDSTKKERLVHRREIPVAEEEGDRLWSCLAAGAEGQPGIEIETKLS